MDFFLENGSIDQNNRIWQETKESEIWTPLKKHKATEMSEKQLG